MDGGRSCGGECKLRILGRKHGCRLSGGVRITPRRHRLQSVEILALQPQRHTRRRNTLALRRRGGFIAITFARLQVLLVFGCVFLECVPATLVQASGDRAAFLDFCVGDARVREGGAEAGRLWAGLYAEKGMEGAAGGEDVGGEVGGRR